MEKKPLVIFGSARKDSNTKTLIQKLLPGADFDSLDLLDYPIEHYNYNGSYSSRDQFDLVIEKILQFDTIVFATPVYWYSMSGLLKVFFDRLTDVVTIQKGIGRELKGKRIFLVSVGTDSALPEGFEVPFKLTANYLEMDYVAAYYCSAKELDTEITNAAEFVEKVSNINR
jgi:multimeric flavodoxin WrbA